MPGNDPAAVVSRQYQLHLNVERIRVPEVCHCFKLYGVVSLARSLAVPQKSSLQSSLQLYYRPMMFGIDQAGLAEVLHSIAAAIPQPTRAQLLQARPAAYPPRCRNCRGSLTRNSAATALRTLRMCS